MSTIEQIKKMIEDDAYKDAETKAMKNLKVQFPKDEETWNNILNVVEENEELLFTHFAPIIKHSVLKNQGLIFFKVWSFFICEDFIEEKEKNPNITIQNIVKRWNEMRV